MTDENTKPRDSSADLEDMVASSDSGVRKPVGMPGKLLVCIAAAWSLFQLWIASPVPFILGFGVFSATESRSIHLAFALFLAYMAYPAFKRSPRDRIPIQDWLLATVAAFCGAYMFIFYEGLSQRPGAPILQDVIVGAVGVLLLLEATRRALGPPLMIVASVFLIYSLAGPWMPGILSHGGVSLFGLINHQWLTTQGVFGIALGVSTSFVFLFVLFGALLDKAGAGNYFIKVAFSLLGHYKGGPAKAAVVASAMTGLISGSSIANVVTTGTFTIPMMKRAFFRRKGRSCRSSVFGQRSDYAACHGRGRVPDGRIRRHFLCRCHQACLLARPDILHRTGLYRSSGGFESQHGGPCKQQSAQAPGAQSDGLSRWAFVDDGDGYGRLLWPWLA